MLEQSAGDRLGIVFSTQEGRMCPNCGRPQTKCTCHTTEVIPSGDGIVRVSRETKGRKGKGVTIVTGIPVDKAELKRIAKQLKNQCGSGGTVKERTIEIQGEHRDRLVTILCEMGYTAKRAGG